MRVAGAFTWTNAGGGSTAVYYSRQLLRCLRGITKARLRQHVSRGEDDVVDGNAARARRGEGDVSDGREEKEKKAREEETGGGWEIEPRASAARERAITRAAARCRDIHRGGASSHAKVTRRVEIRPRATRGIARDALDRAGPRGSRDGTRGGADHRRSFDGNECATTSGRERGGTLTR